MNEEDVRRIVREMIKELVQPKLDDMERGVIAAGALADGVANAVVDLCSWRAEVDTGISEIRNRQRIFEGSIEGMETVLGIYKADTNNLCCASMRHDLEIAALRAEVARFRAGVPPHNLGMGLPKGLLGIL